MCAGNVPAKFEAQEPDGSARRLALSWRYIQRAYHEGHSVAQPVRSALARGEHTEARAMNEESYWQAVQTRDAGADGMFFYAVRSTGIYCRPTCPSRRPRRDQVLFFQQPDAAEQAGFRPCLRCSPRKANAHEPQVELIQRACDYIAERADDAPTLEEIGQAVGLSPYHLQRTFKRIMGITPRQYAETCRVDRLKNRLKEGDDVTTALYEAGYGSSSRLYEQAPTRLGMTPATYRRGGLGA